MNTSLAEYLRDPLLCRMYDEIRAVEPLRPIQVDITHVCNIRCDGCYFFEESLDQFESPRAESDFDAFITREKERGTNYVTVVGGEPSLVPERLKKMYDAFWMVVVTNGLRRIPLEGFENMPIVVSVWGDHATDTKLRGGGNVDVFEKGLENYRNDRRAIWYYTTSPGNVGEIESVVDQIVGNGNFLAFNFYGDIAGFGGALDHRAGFQQVRDEMDRMIDRYPDRILFSSYLSSTISSGRLYDDQWGFDVCCSLSTDLEHNQQRFKNGKPYLPHFRAYNPDFKTTRGCCRGDSYDCSNCFDTWVHMAWVMVNIEQHLGSKEEFTNWLSTVYIFYLTSRLVDFDAGVTIMPEIHARLSRPPADSIERLIEETL